jgi:myo-inositol-1(or 4)-monophosphatase
VSPLDLLDRARAAAEQAASFIRSAARPVGPPDWTIKGRRDFVTRIDQEAEQIIADVLRRGAPEGHVVGEELSPDLVTRGLVWIVDPLDGTTNFLHGFPWYAVSIAAAVDGVVEAGVVHHVPRDEAYFACRGGGAWLGEQRLGVSTIDEPEFALIATGFPFRDLSLLAEYQHQFGRIAAGTSGIRRAGAAALDLADVAAGRFDGFWEQHLSAWDIAAGSLLIREAGGRVTDFTGRNIAIEHTAVVAGNPRIHQWLMTTLGAEAMNSW